MQPILDIQQIRTDLFTYSLGAARQLARPCEDLFESIDGCLRDAGEGLARYFDRVQIFYAGIPLGTHAVATLVHDTVSLLEELRRRLAAIYRARAARWAAPPAGAHAAVPREKALQPRPEERKLLLTL